ncbi:MAG: tetratricopeptide repeat protein [Bacteroidales bacterium]|nr:tetratricopeptide repeat protein [Bacteroidales bacterium]
MRFLFLWFAIMMVFLANGQRSYIYNDSRKFFKIGQMFFDEEKYGVAQLFFEKYINLKEKFTEDLIVSDAAYYNAICALELFNQNSEKLINDYLYYYRENSRYLYANFKMGKYWFSKKYFKEAIKWFEKVNASDLDKKEKNEYYFKLGYCYFLNEDYNKAEKCFYEIKDIPNDYHDPALYYYSYIAYIKKNYEVAAEGFKKLENNEIFKEMIPYYLGQIYYLQQKYEKVIEYLEPKLPTLERKRAIEMNRIVGESYYKLNKFTLAQIYLEKYLSECPSPQREDYYQLAYCYYQTRKINKAIEYLEKITIKEDSLTQQSLYLLSECYIQNALKNKARLTLSKVAKMNFYPELQEEALFNFAKISFELSYTPFNEAIVSFKEFLNKYPNSLYSEDAKTYLAKAYLFSKNYKEALEIMENIKEISPEIEEAFTRASFYYGLELFKNLDFENSIKYLDQCINNSKYNQKYLPYALYWRGEAYYRLKDYKNSLNSYERFIKTPNAYSTEYFILAYYSIAYCYFHLKDYANAQLWYRKYVENEKNKNKIEIFDAYNRVGDCFFMLKRYEDAIENYEKVANANVSSADYSLYQLSKCYIILSDNRNAIINLNKLIENYKNSSYIHMAYLDLASAYEFIGENSMAINTLQKFISSYPNSSLITKAYLKLGLIYFNSDNNDKAIETFKIIIEQYPNCEEYKSAITSLKNVYIENNDINSYYSYISEKAKNIPVSETEKDSVLYLTAEKNYMNANCTKAIQAFKEYLTSFPKGFFTLQANYYLAECLYNTKNYDEALKYFSEVLKYPYSKFTEPALVTITTYYYKNKEYAKCIPYYSMLLELAQNPENLLKAKIGLMRCNFYLNNIEEAAKYARSLINEQKLPEEIFIEAHYVIGKQFYINGKYENALEAFTLIAKDCKTPKQAEAKSLIAEIQYKLNRYDEAEATVIDFVKKNTPQQYWLAKAFITLGDVYIAKNNLFQARATLQSIIDNYKNNDDGIKEEARKKILEIENIENSKYQNTEINKENIENE